MYGNCTPAGQEKAIFLKKGYQDLGNTIKGAWSRNTDSIKKYAENLKDLGDKGTVAKIFLTIVNVLAMIAVVICGSLITAVITFINIIILLAFMAIVYVGFTFIWFVDRVYLIRKKIFTACHECKEKSLIPTYICPTCGAKHTNLTPGVYGILKRRCNCGEKLPTTFFNGRKNLEAECPVCGHKLMDRESRPICIPVVGGRSVGKTAFITAFPESSLKPLPLPRGSRLNSITTKRLISIVKSRKITSQEAPA